MGVREASEGGPGGVRRGSGRRPEGGPGGVREGPKRRPKEVRNAFGSKTGPRISKSGGSA